MKLQYKHQTFQEEAARCVVRAFEGQPYQQANEYLQDPGKEAWNNQLGLETALRGYGNAPLMLSRDAIATNVRTIQREHDIKPIDALEGEGISLTVEMETGTGKTYTYIKTMYELNKQYGWSKFIIVVPSVAIREGVFKSFEMMKEHFSSEYNKPMQYFIYNSSQLTKIDAFGSDNNLHVMIINMQAFNTSLNEEKNKEGRGGDSVARIIFSKRDDFGSRRPIDILAATNPIIIIDEPQTVLGANKKNATRKGLKLFNPLMMLLYSATHREVRNMVFRLDAIDAYKQRLVKKISVKGIHQVGATGTEGFVHLDEVIVRRDQNPQARLTFERMGAGGTISRITRVVDEGFDLYEQSDELEAYREYYKVETIDGKAETVQFANGIKLSVGDSVNSDDTLRLLQIRETIKSHLERERKLYPMGIKVLSLFFIDHVENYRTYHNGTAEKGKYARMFEEEYRRAVSELSLFENEAYRHYLSKNMDAEKAHNGYFSVDRRGEIIDSRVSRGESDSNDQSAYDLIMKNKERLLSLDEKTRFIFSHSALKEGWDNPNVFQICTLKETDNTTRRRQEVGRGMRLCVDQKGIRQDAGLLGNEVFDINVLTVIASESYESFAAALQHEIAEVVSERRRKITCSFFVGNIYQADSVDGEQEGTQLTVDEATSNALYNQLIREKYVDDDGKLTPKYYNALETDTLQLDSFAPYKGGIVRTLENVYCPEGIKVENADKAKEASFRMDCFRKKEFQELWQQINAKTSYRVAFSTDELVEKAAEALNKNLSVTQIRYEVHEGHMEEIEDKEALRLGKAMQRDAVRVERLPKRTINQGVRYDLIGSLIADTGLTRKTVIAILKRMKEEKFALFGLNPEEFLRKTGKIINDAMASTLVQQISYVPTEEKYDVDVFTANSIRGELGVTAMESESKSLYDLVVTDSTNELRFAADLEQHEEVIVYTKLPRGFYINTPMGHYNPDWAIVFKEKGVKHVYFVAETKGSMQTMQLREVEKAKIECAKRHFKAVSEGENPVVYKVVSDYKQLSDQLTQ